MAGEHFPVNGHAGALEDLRPFIEEAVDVIRIHKGNFHRDRIQKRGQLFHGHVTAGHYDLAHRIEDCGNLPALRSLPAFLFHAEAQVVILLVVVDAVPFLLCEVHRADWEQDVLLLVDHFLGPGQHGVQPGAPFCAVIAFFCKRPKLIANLVVHRPHHIGGTGDAVSHLQQGIEQIALFGIMDRKLTNRRDKSFISALLKFCEQIGKRRVFFCQRVQRMSGDPLHLGGSCILIRVVLFGEGVPFRQLLLRLFPQEGSLYFLFRIGDFFLGGSAVEQGGVDVTEPLHFRKRRSLFHEFLLRLHDFGCLYITKLTDEVRPDILQVFTFAKPFQIDLELFGAAFGRIVCFLRRRLRRRSYIRHLTDKLKAFAHQGDYDIHHRDILHLRAFGNRHDLADGVQHGLFGDLGKPEPCHDLDQLRVFLCQFIDGFIQIKFFCHSVRPPLCFSVFIIDILRRIVCCSNNKATHFIPGHTPKQS